jgi:hypothetical protein
MRQNDTKICFLSIDLARFWEVKKLLEKNFLLAIMLYFGVLYISRVKMTQKILSV